MSTANRDGPTDLLKELTSADRETQTLAIASAAAVAYSINRQHFGQIILNNDDQLVLTAFSNLYIIGKKADAGCASIGTISDLINANMLAHELSDITRPFGASSHINGLLSTNGLSIKGYELLDRIVGEYFRLNGSIFVPTTTTVLLACVGYDPTPSVKFQANIGREDIELRLTSARR